MQADLQQPVGRFPWQPVALLVFLVVAAIAGRVLGVTDELESLRGWVLAQGLAGAAVFTALFAAGVVLSVPGTALTLLSGVLFGCLAGTAVTSIGATIGATVSFVVARYFARKPLARWLGRKDKFRRFDEMTERHGAIMVAITRLIPIIPLNLENYAFGLTRVPLGTYVFWSWLGMLPSTIVYVAGADAFMRGTRQAGIPWPQLAVVGVALATLVGMVLYVGREYARREARRREFESESDAGQGSEEAVL